MPNLVHIYIIIDDDLHPNVKNTWMTEFEDALRFRLSQLLGTVQIQLVKASENVVFDENAIKIWCLSEALLEIPTVQNHLKILHEKNFFIYQHPISSALTSPFYLKKSYSFYKIDYDTELVQVYGNQKDKALHLGFWSEINDLAADITQLQLQKEIKFVSKIYLAHTGDDVQEFRSILKRELKEYGYQVVPDAILPYQTVSCMDTINQNLEDCELAIHLFGGYFDEKLDDKHLSLSALQNTLAAQKSDDSNLQRLIWLPPKITIEDERQEEIVRHIRQNPKAQVGAEIFETSIEELKFAIHERLQERFK